MSKELFSIKGKVCLVTGVSRGLGAHIAQLYLSHGAKIIGISREEPRWDVSTYADSFEHFIGDVTDASAVEKLFAHVSDVHGNVDVVVNNAGISQVQRLDKIATHELQKIFDLNVYAATNIATRASAQMRKNKVAGSIINITSVMSDSSMTGLAAYSASKAALSQLTKSMAIEWARSGVRVNNLSPGWFPSAMTDEYFNKGLGQVLKARVPMARLGEASDLDGACLLLASDASRYMTGTTLTVDGGYSLIS
ncbi:SDR family NAD(P)-dependent oxidoreductase [Ahrensia kielensis]|uniref:SDR family NAD(P)-dependent oxidoreductase n=1 Tax=Ahrensia kielensis TaxID=76980 RepID=UPI0003604F80|nr:SDR family oxidoreductase [Ahrensia kielensis]